MQRRRPILVVILILAISAYFFLTPRLPKDQAVNVVLGDDADRVTDITLRYTVEGETETAREATFHYDHAPRVVHHEARLPNGDYVLVVDLRGAGAAHVERKVTLNGGSTSIDVSETRLATNTAPGSP